MLLPPTIVELVIYHIATILKFSFMERSVVSKQRFMRQRLSPRHKHTQGASVEDGVRLGETWCGCFAQRGVEMGAGNPLGP